MFTIKIIEAMVKEIELLFKEIVGKDVEFLHNDKREYTCKLCGNKHIGSFVVDRTQVYVCPTQDKRIIRIFDSNPTKVSDGAYVKVKNYGCGWTISIVDMPHTTPPAQCEATTKKGVRCKNTPQKGFNFCGPHLTSHHRQLELK